MPNITMLNNKLYVDSYVARGVLKRFRSQYAEVSSGIRR